MDNIKMTPLLQRDYGGRLDCSLTCITAVIYHLLNETKTPEEIYDVVEKNAKKRLYRSESGTIPFFIKGIFNASLKEFNLEPNVKSRYIKGLFFNFNTIKEIIDKGSPVILNIWNDGKDYYKNHSITVIGYEPEKKILYIYDNWSKNVNSVEYDKISFISSINWL